jgi:hypothetical protein
VRWHRELFRLSWKRGSKGSSHKPKVAAETITLIKEMAKENRLWGAEIGPSRLQANHSEVHEDGSHTAATRPDVVNLFA